MKQKIFVVHHHLSKRPHFDLRLEMDGVLKSWAVPKGVPEESGVRRLAVAVDDHPLDYATFEGKIAPGHYGAGEVKIFDNGTYELLERGAHAIKFVFHGRRLKGEYELVDFKRDGKNWLLFKKASLN
ncbi:MAG: DNA polymerase ligase N-terminal domain-containing protein [Candidatus Micrarchaeota archaeon]